MATHTPPNNLEGIDPLRDPSEDIDMEPVARTVAFEDLPPELRDIIYTYLAPMDEFVLTSKRIAKSRNPAIREKEDFGFTSVESEKLSARDIHNDYRVILRQQILEYAGRYQMRVNVHNFDFNSVRKFMNACGALPRFSFHIHHVLDKSFSASANGLDKWVKYVDGVNRGGVQVLACKHFMFDRLVEKLPGFWQFVEARSNGMGRLRGEQKKVMQGIQEFFQRDVQALLNGPAEDESDGGEEDEANGEEVDEAPEEDQAEERGRGYIAGMAPDPEPYTDTEDEDENSEMGDAEGEYDYNHAGQFDVEEGEDTVGGAEMKEDGSDEDENSDYDISEDEMDIDDMEVDPIMKLVEDAMARNKADD